MPEYIFALLAAMTWACAAQFLNRAMKNLPAEERALHIAIGLQVSISTGALLLIIASLSLGQKLESPSWALCMAGVFTFPVGTGLYFLCGYLFGKRAEYASQFSNVKPGLSMLLAWLVLGEVFPPHSLLPILLVLVGIIVLLSGVVVRHFTFYPLLIGLLLAGSWAIGETFMGMALKGTNSLNATITALLVGCLCGGVIVVPFVVAKREGIRFCWSWVIPYACHGVLSFCIGYLCFFESIATIGLGRSVIVTAFWPLLALVLRVLLGSGGWRHNAPPWRVLVSSFCFLAGSLAQILLIHFLS